MGLAVEPVGLEPLAVDLERGRAGLTASLAPTPRMIPLPTGVSAAAQRIPFTLDARVLDPDALPGGGALGEPDVFRALQKLPGVSSRGDYSATLWTRNAPWGMTQVLLDGLPLYDPIHLGGIASGLAAEGLEAIALLPGARPASLAEGAAGTVALETAPADDRAVVAALSSLALRTRAEDRWFGDRLGVALTARRSWWDKVRPPSFLTGGESDGDVDYRFRDVAGRIDVRAGSGVLLEAGGLWEQDHLFGDIPDLVSASEGEWGNRAGWLRASRTLGRVRLRLMTGRVDYGVRTRPLPWAAFIGPDGSPSLDLLVSELDHAVHGIRLDGVALDERLTWAAGYRTVSEGLHQRGIEASDMELPGVDERLTLRRGRAWLETSVRLGELDLAGGLSRELTPDDLPVRRWVPSARARWQASDHVRLELAHGGGTQYTYPVAPAEISLGPGLAAGYLWVLAGEGTPALSSRTTSAAMAVSLPHGVEARVTGWWREVEGIWMRNVTLLDSGRVRPISPDDPWGSERGSGFEVGMAWSGESAGVDLAWSRGRSTFVEGGGLSWTSPAERRNSVDLQAHGRVPGDLVLTLNLTAESGWPYVLGPGVSCDPEDEFCEDLPDGGDPLEDHEVVNAPAYVSLDLHAEWERSLGSTALVLSGSVRNALGRDNAAAWRAGTCGGRALISPVCQSAQGLGRFAPGLTHPTPSLAVQVRF